jgi:hypothetical protein
MPGIPACRFCGKKDGELEAVQLEVSSHRGVIQPRTSEKTYYQHQACLEAERAFNAESERRAAADRKAVEGQLSEVLGP